MFGVKGSMDNRAVYIFSTYLLKGLQPVEGGVMPRQRVNGYGHFATIRNQRWVIWINFHAHLLERTPSMLHPVRGHGLIYLCAYILDLRWAPC